MNNEITITYFASNDSMGDTDDNNCDRFRKYAKEILENEYPDFEITVSDEQSLQTCHIDGVDDYHLENEISEFCHGLWDGADSADIWEYEND